MKRYLALICICLSCLSIFGGVAHVKSAAHTIPESTIHPDDSSEWIEQSLSVGEDKRWYRVLKPKGFRPGQPAVVVLHGGTLSMRRLFDGNTNASKHWQTLSQREGVLLIVPNGTNPRTGNTKGDRQNWNDLRTDASNPELDDVQFIAQLVKKLQSEYRFDSKRVYVTGASNGGMMTFRLLIEKPDLFAAGVAFIASMPADYSGIQRPKPATPLLMCNGTADPLVKWSGGKVALNRGSTCSIDAAVAWWAKTNNCRPKPATVKMKDRDTQDGCRMVRQIYDPQKDGADFEFIKIENGGHTLPSRNYSLPDNRLVKRLIGTMCRDVEGVELAWQFMKKQSR